MFISGIYLAVTLFNKTNNVQAASTYEGRTNRNGDAANCRTQGASCTSRAEFLGYNEGSMSVNQMLYCRTLGSTQNDGFQYGTWEADDVARCYPSLCANNPGYNPDGVNAACQNPYKCPPPVSTPAPERGNITVQAKCDGNINLAISFSVSRGGGVLATGTTTQNVAFDGRSAVDVSIGGDTEVNNSYKVQYPNIRRTSDPIQTDQANGSTVTFNYTGCAPTLTTTVSPTPTKITLPPACIDLVLDGGVKARELSPGQDVNLTMTVQNSKPTSNSGIIVPYNLNNLYSVNNPKPAMLPLNNIAGYSPLSTDKNSPTAIAISTTGDGASPIRTFKWKLRYDQIFAADSNNGGEVLTAAQFNGYAGGTSAYDPKCVASVSKASVVTITPPITITPPVIIQKTPGVSIKKTLTSTAQPVGQQVNFNIDVKNTGDVDLRDFVVVDDFDPAYLQFISASNGGQPLPPVLGNGQNGRSTLTWNDLPAGNGILKIGETYQIMLTFKSLKDSRPTSTIENDNCGIVSQITFVDNTGQTVIDTINDQRSCAEFTNTTVLTVQVSKSTLTPSVSVGQEVRFQSVITNNTTDKTYSKIDFVDIYDKTYLKPLRVKVTGTNGATKTYCAATGTGCDGVFNTTEPIRINDIQTVDGALAPGKAYTFEIVFMAQAPITSTCDTVKTDVVDNIGAPTSGTSIPACAEIIAPPPPKTGVSFIWSFMAPATVLAVSTAGRVALKYKMLA